MNIEITKMGLISAKMQVEYVAIRLTNTETSRGGVCVEMLDKHGNVVGTMRSGYEMRTGDTLEVSGLVGVIPVTVN